MTASLTNISYGKSCVRLTKVDRHADEHVFTELNVDVTLEGAFEAAYTRGDNRRIVATDSMKNSVLALAGEDEIESIEAFALRLANHFLATYEQVTGTDIHISKRPWRRALVNDQPHPHTFLAGSEEVATTTVAARRNDPPQVVSGIASMMLVKTAGSKFTHFVRDEFTTLADDDDRILQVELNADWRCDSMAEDWNTSRATTRAALVETFAQHESESLQQTLHELGQAALLACRQIHTIELVLLNRHLHSVDLTSPSSKKESSVFVPTDVPYGKIRGTVLRDSRDMHA